MSYDQHSPYSSLRLSRLDELASREQAMQHSTARRGACVLTGHETMGLSSEYQGKHAPPWKGDRSARDAVRCDAMGGIGQREMWRLRG